MQYQFECTDAKAKHFPGRTRAAMKIEKPILSWRTRTGRAQIPHRSSGETTISQEQYLLRAHQSMQQEKSQTQDDDKGHRRGAARGYVL